MVYKNENAVYHALDIRRNTLQAAIAPY